MNTGGIITDREAAMIRERLSKIASLTRDKRILEQCRMAGLLINKSVRRAKRLEKK